MCGRVAEDSFAIAVQVLTEAQRSVRAQPLIYLAFSAPPPHIGQDSPFWPAFSSCDDPSQPQAQNQAMRRLPLFAAPKVPFDLGSLRCATDATRARSLIHFGSGFFSSALTSVPVPSPPAA
jgi:hypothetical protein